MSDQPHFVPVAKPSLDEREADAARRAILSGWVTQGPEVAAFEHEFAAYVGAKHACAVSSCTAALHLALLGVGVGVGDEVITVSHSFIATANAVRYVGATPVFVDIQLDTFNIDPTQIEAAITPRTRAILCVHQLGMPCDLPAILAVARQHGLPVVEDAACAVGSEIRYQNVWEKIGRPWGDVACFSFHPRKLLTTGDGGMLTTADSELDHKFRLWRQHGMSVPDTVRHGSREVIFESYESLGFNYRLNDIQAAVGREQLKRLPQAIERRRLFASRYSERLATIPGVVAPAEPAWARSNWQSYCVRLPNDVDQRTVMQVMLDRGVATRRGVMCAHLEPAYARRQGVHPAHRDGQVPAIVRGTLEHSEQAQEHCIMLPIFDQMTHAEQDTVIEALRAACEAAVGRGAPV